MGIPEKLSAVILLASAMTTGHAKDPNTPADQVSAIANTYYAAFHSTGSPAAIPMHENLTFSSPRFSLTGATAFKEALSTLFKRVQSLHITQQIHNDNTVLTFYQLDLGIPGGPIPMAERLQIDNGVIKTVELIFDSARLPPPGSAP